MADYLTREDALGINPIGGFKSCCAFEIQRVWKMAGSSLNVVHYEGKCPVCKHYIGLTPTSEEEAKKFLENYKIQ